MFNLSKILNIADKFPLILENIKVEKKIRFTPSHVGF